MVVDVSDDQREGSIQIGFPQHETMHPRALSLAVAKTPSSAPIDLGFGHQICSPSPPSPHPAPTALAQPAVVRGGAIKVVALPPHEYLHSCALPSARAKTPSPPPPIDRSLLPNWAPPVLPHPTPTTSVHPTTLIQPRLSPMATNRAQQCTTRSEIHASENWR